MATAQEYRLFVCLFVFWGGCCYCLVVSYYFGFFGARNQIQGFKHARQELYN
jgi:hypothetical protein